MHQTRKMAPNYPEFKSCCLESSAVACVCQMRIWDVDHLKKSWQHHLGTEQPGFETVSLYKTVSSKQMVDMSNIILTDIIAFVCLCLICVRSRLYNENVHFSAPPCSNYKLKSHTHTNTHIHSYTHTHIHTYTHTHIHSYQNSKDAHIIDYHYRQIIKLRYTQNIKLVS